MLLVEYVGHIGPRSLTGGHLGRHLEYISKRSMMSELHQLDSSSTMPQQQEPTKQKKKKNKIKFQVILVFYRTT